MEAVDFVKVRQNFKLSDFKAEDGLVRFLAQTADQIAVIAARVGIFIVDETRKRRAGTYAAKRFPVEGHRRVKIVERSRLFALPLPVRGVCVQAARVRPARKMQESAHVLVSGLIGIKLIPQCQHDK